MLTQKILEHARYNCLMFVLKGQKWKVRWRICYTHTCKEKLIS